MKQILIGICVLLLFCLPSYATNSGDTNIDGGGGGSTEDGTGENFWNVGNDGVRVTIVSGSTFSQQTTPVDFSNKVPIIEAHFGMRSKLYYRNGNPLKLYLQSGYTSVQPISPIPPIVTASGGNNIEAVKNYFSLEGTLQDICEKAGFSFPDLLSGKYVIMLEPVVYITYNGIKYAMTATEAALMDVVEGGRLKSNLGNITHQNLPLAMFLERDDLGISAWTGSRTGIRANSDIVAQLGVGTVRFQDIPCCNHPKDCACIQHKDKPLDCTCKENHPGKPCDPEDPNCDCKPPAGEYDYEYRTNTDVITAVTVYDPTGKGVNPNAGASVTFQIDGKAYTKSGIVVGPDDSQLVWVKWNTGENPRTLNISVEGRGVTLGKSTITANIVDLVEETPPNTEGRDRNDGFYQKPTRNFGSSTGHNWTKWWAWWQPKWVWVGGENGHWVDMGKWIYEIDAFHASLVVRETKLFPDERVKTEHKNAFGKFEMKSGYGVNLDVALYITDNSDEESVTPIQNGVAVFPEFDFKTYDRLLVPRQNASFQDIWSFAPNPFSQFQNPVHFVPIWYPDDTKFEVAAVLFDAWTPVGQMYATTQDYVTIDGDVYDDWYIAPY